MLNFEKFILLVGCVQCHQICDLNNKYTCLIAFCSAALISIFERSNGASLQKDI